MPEFLSTQQVASRLGVSQETVRRWLRANALPASFDRGSYRVAEEDLRAFLHRRLPSSATRAPAGHVVSTLLQSRLLSLLDQTYDEIIIWRFKGPIVYWNRGAEVIYGYSTEEALGETTHHLLHTIHPVPLEETFDALLKTGRWEGELQHTTVHGQHIFVESRKVLSVEPDGERWIIETNRDITARREVQEGMLNNLLLLEGVVEGTADPLAVKNREGCYLLVNPVAARIIGGLVEEILGKDDRAFFPSEIAQTLMETDRRIMNSGGAETIEERLVVDGKQKVYLSTKSALFNKRREVIGLIVQARDITERLQLEQQKDEFLRMTSHELKTPVTSLKGYTQMLLRRLQGRDDPQMLRSLARMDAQLNRLTRLINDLLDLSKIQAGELVYNDELFRLQDLVSETLELLQLSTHHRLELVCVEETPVYADRDRIAQMLINLVTNAIKYSSEAERVVVRVVAEGLWTRVTVQDFGIGIAPQYHRRVFERFFQVPDPLEQTFPGLGIGLFLANEIVTHYGGHMEVESEKGAGSTFGFMLPLSLASPL